MFSKNNFIIYFLVVLSFQLAFSVEVFAQEEAAKKTDERKPNGRRIRRNLNMVIGVEHDEEFLIPLKDIRIQGRTDFFDITRIGTTDFFRFLPKKAGSGVSTINDAKTGQTLVEIHFDIRDDSVEKKMREIQALLGDIEGLEYKIVNDKILLDGYVLLPRDLIRIANVVTQFGDSAKSLATLSPLSRKKIAEYITKDVNNPSVQITAIGDFLKLEGEVNSVAEKTRIKDIVSLYMPDLVIEQGMDLPHLKIVGRKGQGAIENFIIDLITVRKDEDKVEPPPKMIQVVTHFVEYNDSFSKGFDFNFSPSLTAIGSSASRGPTSTLAETTQIINNLLPKLKWGKFHGFARVLDTASILVQDGALGSISRNLKLNIGFKDGANGAKEAIIADASVNMSVVPKAKAERSGLIELKDLKVSVQDGNENGNNNTSVNTIITVRSGFSAAFGGTIKKQSSNTFGGAPSSNDKEKEALVTFKQGKTYSRKGSQFVVFVTPTIKSSASAGVDQVKKKFRLRD